LTSIANFRWIRDVFTTTISEQPKNRRDVNWKAEEEGISV